MEKLKTMTAEELSEKYYRTFGEYPLCADRDRIICALWYGKNPNYLTLEELETINED